MLDFLLGLANGCVYFNFNFLDDASAIEFALHYFVGLQESLQLARKLVVLTGDQVHVFVKRLYFVLHGIRRVDETVVVLSHLFQIVLERL